MVSYFKFGKNRKKHTNRITADQAEHELPNGWGYVISNGEIIGIEKNPVRMVV